MTVTANSNNAPPIANNPAFRLFILAPFLPIDTDELANLSVAHAKPTNIAAKAATTPTAFHNSLVSKNVNAIIAPTNIAIDMAISFKALAFMLRAKEFNTLEVLFSTFLTPSNIPAKLSKTPTNVSNALANLYMVATIATLMPKANTLSQSILLNISIILDPIFLRSSHNLDSISLMPLYIPKMAFLPISKNFHDGE